MVQVELTGTATDAGGLLALSRAGRFVVKHDPSGATRAEWSTVAGTRTLTWLAPEDHGPLIYAGLSVWAGQSLGTPCDPFITSSP
jgi:hypothetical protein